MDNYAILGETNEEPQNPFPAPFNSEPDRSLEDVLYGDLGDEYTVKPDEFSEEKFKSLIEQLENFKKTNHLLAELLSEAETANRGLTTQLLPNPDLGLHISLNEQQPIEDWSLKLLYKVITESSKSSSEPDALIREVIGVVRVCLRDYATSCLIAFLPSLCSQQSEAANLFSLIREEIAYPRLTPDQQFLVFCILATAGWCGETSIQLQEKLSQQIPGVDISQKTESFYSITNQSLLVFVQDVESIMMLLFDLLVNWSAVDCVGDESPFIGAMPAHLRQAVPLIRDMLSDRRKYFAHFCLKLATQVAHKFVGSLFRCRAISTHGAEQLLLDTHSLKMFLLSVPSIDSVINSKPPTAYVTSVNAALTKAEMILKVVMCSLETVDKFVEQCIKLLPVSDVPEMQKVLEMKGVKRQEHSAVLNAYRVQIGAAESETMPQSNSLTSRIGGALLNVGSAASVSEAFNAVVPMTTDGLSDQTVTSSIDKLKRFERLVKRQLPKALNALCTQLMTELANSLETQDTDKFAGAIDITGSERAFAAGADIKEMKPVIAAVNGFALGCGNELAMMCDTIYAGEKARFGQPESNIGTITGAGGTERWARTAEKSFVIKVCLTGNHVSAQKAKEHGIVSEVFPVDQVVGEAVKLGEKSADQSPLIVQVAKETVNKAYGLTLQEGLHFRKRLFHTTFAPKENKKGSDFLRSMLLSGNVPSQFTRSHTTRAKVIDSLKARFKGEVTIKDLPAIKISVKSSSFKSVPRDEQRQEVIDVLPEDWKQRVIIETFPSGSDLDREVRPVRLRDVIKFNGENVTATPQSLLDDSVFMLKQNNGLVASELLWLCGSLSLKNFAHAYRKDPTNHLAKTISSVSFRHNLETEFWIC
uniref:Vps53 C-terminal domain-containing protein n=1 Tax=Caenorhabditis tropicalis TaxID=1561998 RepID=A0A1I7UHN4_9PELO